jgi:hypothetical protein
MSRVSWRPMPGLERPALVAAPGRDAAVCAVVVVLTAGVFAAPLTTIAKVFNILGLVYVTLPARIAVAGFLALRRQWWNLAAFTVGQIQRPVEERQGAA